MAWILTGSSWPCSYCTMVFSNAVKLAGHVQNHSQFLHCPDHGRATEVPRLQKFLDSHLKDEPILGLEYIVERKIKSWYLYTCLLCDWEGTWKMILTHIIGVSHAENFMMRHYPEQTPRPTDYSNHSAYVQALTAANSAVYQSYGGRKIKIHVDNRPFRGKSAGRNDVKVLISVPEETSVLETLKRKTEMDSNMPAKQPRNSDEILNYLSKFTNVNHYCSLCSESCPTAVHLYEHVTGYVHGGKLVSSTAEQLMEFTRMHTFLDTYMKGEPILGLGYIVEKEVKPVYMYTCLLCDVMEDWPRILTHLLKVDHLACYIKKDHRKLSPEREDFNTREDYVDAVIAAALNIHITLGDKAMAQAASADEDDEDEPLPLKGKLKPTLSPDYPRLEYADRREELEILGVSKYKINTCRLCKLTYRNPIELCCHLMGNKHKRRVPQNMQRKLDSPEYLLNTILKTEPILGLEYVWIEETENIYKFTCRLCSMVTHFGHLLLSHCVGQKHICLYMIKHHGDKSCATMRKKVLRNHAVEIYKKHGRKNIQHTPTPIHSAAGTEGHGAPSKVQDQQKSTIVGEIPREQQPPLTDMESDNHKKYTNPESKDQPATAMVPVMAAEEEDGLNASQTSEDQETEYAAMTPLEELEFRKNEDFLEYMKNCELENDKDATVVKQIVQDCNNVLTQYSGEQGKSEERQGTPPSPP